MDHGLKKYPFSTEFAYVCGINLIALGCALSEKSDLGVSVLMAPAYIVYRRVSLSIPAVTYGMAGYGLQMLLLVILGITLRRFRISWLFSFVSALLAAIHLDLFMILTEPLAADTLRLRILWYVLGVLLGAAGASMMFHTYIPPEIYELFDKEMAAHFHWNIHSFVTGFHIVSALISVILSFALFGFGEFVGVKLGSLIAALLNGNLIRWFTNLFEKRLLFKDVFTWRKVLKS